MRKFLVLLGFLLCVEANAQVDFIPLDLTYANRLLLKVSTSSPDYGVYSSLFLADAKTLALRQLTFFPEEILILSGNVLQIQNRFGLFRSGPSAGVTSTGAGFGGMTPVSLYPAFVNGDQIQSVRISPIGSSPDGRYLLFIRPRTAAYGDLVLFEISKGTEIVVAGSVEISLDRFPASWSPDSAFFVYAKGSSLYYFSMSQLQQGRTLSENLRRLGGGGISNVMWDEDGDLHYISGSVLYDINPVELFTRTLYAGFLSIGRIEGRIPFGFDSNFDSFWISPDGARILLNKGGRNVFLYSLAVGDFHDSGDPTSLPYLYLPRDTVVGKVLWSHANIVTLLCTSRREGKIGSTVFRLTPDAEGKLTRFQQVKETGVRDIALSPAEDMVAVLREGEVAWKRYADWKDVGKAAHPQALHVLWTSDTELLIAGAWYTEKRSIRTGTATLVSLSQAADAGFTADGKGIAAKTATSPYAFDEASGTWKAAAAYAVRKGTLVSDSYRAYVEPSARGSYKNLVMIRDAVGFGTVSLVPPESTAYEPLPTEAQSVDFANFAHGSRTGRREVSLVFNAVDSAEGLTGVLNTLSEFGLRVTFFVSGEFIRRYPDAVKEIAQSGHEVGSLFSTYFNMTDERFKLDGTFIQAGLARNEDDYFAATGRELSTLWHAPYYIVNSDIIRAGRGMNYSYIGRDVDPYDWAAATPGNLTMGIYSPAAALVDRIIAEKKPGSIVPILIGTPSEGQRDDYVFQKLGLLINELIKLGYDIVPVSTLMEHAR